MENRLVKRIVFQIKVSLDSPLSVSSGDDEWTDADILRDKSGMPFVSGSSLAGAMRNYLNKSKNAPCLFGYLGKNDLGRMSSLILSDMQFESDCSSAVRDGVKLTEGKVVETGSKYEIEILESDTRAYFYMELTVREQDDEVQMKQEIATIFYGMHTGEIRLGSKKTRGFGKLQIISVKSLTFTKENYLTYKDAYHGTMYEGKADELEEWLNLCNKDCKMIHISVPLKMQGGISIRQYAAKKNEPDYVHISDRGIPVIPGSSFAGAIRHRMKKILEELKANGEIPDSVDEIIDIAFGYVKGKQACSSNIIISESKIRNAIPLVMTRTGISRFEAAARKGALYCEKTYINGEFELKINVRKSQNPADQTWMIGLLLLTIKDLQSGLLAVGGQTAIGRGIFSANGELTIDGVAGREDVYISEILQNLAARKENA